VSVTSPPAVGRRLDLLDEVSRTQDDVEAAEQALVMARVERARAVRRAIDEGGFTLRQVAARIGMTHQVVSKWASHID
jgi:hypothetical protein